MTELKAGDRVRHVMPDLFGANPRTGTVIAVTSDGAWVHWDDHGQIAKHYKAKTLIFLPPDPVTAATDELLEAVDDLVATYATGGDMRNIHWAVGHAAAKLRQAREAT